jgi:hypothetical protein
VKASSTPSRITRAEIAIAILCIACERPSQEPRPIAIPPAPAASPIAPVAEPPPVAAADGGAVDRSDADRVQLHGRTVGSYLKNIHDRVHPFFVSFLGSLDKLPADHPLSDKTLVTRLEIVVSSKDGMVVKMGIVKTSGITAFDIAALDSVNRAQPFAPAEDAIVSPDGNAYLHWEFHRDEVFACSPLHAQLFIVAAKPAGP